MSGNDREQLLEEREAYDRDREIRQEKARAYARGEETAEYVLGFIDRMMKQGYDQETVLRLVGDVVRS